MMIFFGFICVSTVSHIKSKVFKTRIPQMTSYIIKTTNYIHKVTVPCIDFDVTTQTVLYCSNQCKKNQQELVSFYQTNPGGPIPNGTTGDDGPTVSAL